MNPPSESIPVRALAIGRHVWIDRFEMGSTARAWVCTVAAGLLAALVASCGPGQTEEPAPTCEELGTEICSTSLETLRLSIDGSRFLDADGREVILRGANAGGRSKLDPFFPFPFAESGLPEQADAPAFETAAGRYADRLVDWGFNVARMPLSWEALEPERGTYDLEYLGRYRRLAEIMGGRDIRVIVDFHQDVFARPFCGDGFPIWAVPDPVPETPEDCSSWFMGYFTNDAVKAAFDRFWANEDGLRDAFLEMWALVAAELDQVDAVVGFEIVNEPHHGTAEEAEWAADVLTPFYESAASTIRSAAPGALVFFDSTGTDAVNTTTEVQRPAGDFFVFAPHFYHAAAFMGDIPGTPRPSDAEVATFLGRWAGKRGTWDLPVLVGEYGIKPTVEWAAEYVRSNYDAFDLHLLHATIWEYSTTEDDWNDEAMSIIAPDGSETVVVGAAVRAYPRAVAGRITSYAYDSSSLTGELAFEAEAGGVTEISVPERLAADGFQAFLEGVEGCVASCVPGVIHVLATEAGTATLSFEPSER